MNSGFVPVRRDALERWRDAFAEELSAYDLDPPLHHVNTSHDEIDAALRAALEQPGVEPYGWRTIDTAPKDGTAVLVMRDIWPGTPSGRAEICNGHNTYVAEWRDGDNAWVCYMDAVCDPHCPVEPTHWMPLPRPPSAPQPTQQAVGPVAEVSGSPGNLYIKFLPAGKDLQLGDTLYTVTSQPAQQQVDWTQVGKLIEVIHDQRVRQHITGTSNWAAAVCRLMEEETRPVKKEERM